ncbi:MAG: non-heme iron oxygenase ferredoxin subunit [Anaerolineae bacterium]|nr:non-heme iron oxygenase ferredoxin subunit [Anaerolineae bacterium]
MDRPADSFVSIAKLDDVKEGEIFATLIDETPIALTKVDGEICAFGDICTHDDGPLAEGTIEDGCVVCPRHGARFNLHTGKQTFPAVTPIPIYETKIEGDEIKVKL